MAVLLLSLAAFLSTNVDSLFVLLALIGESARRRTVVFAGYALGSACLLATAVACSELALRLPLRYVGLLGVLPILLGAILLLGRARSKDDPSLGGAGLRARSNINVGYVFAVTLASGTDNIAVYVPIYATHPTPERCVITLVLLAMAIPWFGVAAYLASHRPVAPQLERYGRALIPWLMIAIGVTVLQGSRALPWQRS